MDFKFDETLIASVFSSFKHMASVSYNSIGALEADETLSIAGQTHLNALKFCALQTNRLCNMVSFLMSPDTDISDQKLETFEIENLLNEITSRFSSTVSAYSPVVAECHVNLKHALSILINKSKFELLFLNLLYCCAKKRPDSKPSPIKLSIYATENKDSIIFHIRDNNPCLSPEIINSGFSDFNHLNDLPGDLSFSTLVSLSLRVAQKSARQLNATISHTPLKSGNRFDISIPKFKTKMDNQFRSPILYTPTNRYFNETFADILLEFYLQKVIDNLESLEVFYV